MRQQFENDQAKGATPTRMPQFVAIPLTGLRDCVRAMCMGFESSLARLILRMTWGGKQWRLYAGLTILYALTQLMMLMVNNYIHELWKIDPLRTDLLWRIAITSTNLPIPMLLVVTAIGAGIRQFLRSETYRNDLRTTPNSRADIFKAGIGAYIPFLLFLLFVVSPTTIWVAQFFRDREPSTFIDILLGFSIRYVIDEKDYIVAAWGILTLVLGVFTTLLSFLLMLFPMAYLRNFPLGIAIAAVLPTLFFLMLSLPSFAILHLRIRYFESSLVGHGDFWIYLVDRLVDIFFYCICILALGVVWHIAQRRFERGLLPLEEGFE